MHKKLGNTHLALINFSWATDLDPKGTNNHIKEALDKRYMVDDDDDDEMSNICKYTFNKHLLTFCKVLMLFKFLLPGKLQCLLILMLVNPNV